MMALSSTAKQQYETLMSNIAQAKGLHNLPKKELNQIGQDLGLSNLKKHEMIHSISSKLIQMIMSSSTMDIPSHPAIENSPILKEIIKGFFDQFGAGKQSIYTQSQQQQQQQLQQQQQNQLYLQQLMELYGGGSGQGMSAQQSQLYQYLLLQASQQGSQPLIGHQANQAQLQQLLAYSQYPMTSQQLTQIQQLLAQQQQPQTSSLPSTASTLSALQLQQAAAGSGLSTSSLTPQQQYLYYQQYLQDPSFTSLTPQQQQYIIQQIQQQQQQVAQQYQLSSQQLSSQTAQQQLLQQQAQYLQQQNLQQQQQQQYQNQQLYMQTQQATVAPNNSADKQELNKTECICNSCERLNRDLNKLREEERSKKAIECVTCKNKFHPTCVKVSVNSEQARIYECPICTLEKLDPLNKPVEVIQPPTIISGQGCITYFQVSNELYLKLGKKNHSVEIRCIRIDGTKNMYETTWPDSGECSLNNQKLKEYQPLQQNSSLKKRKDEKYTLKDVSMIQKGLNLIQIKENIHQNTKSSYRIDPNSIHVFAIYLVRKVPHAEFISTIPIRAEEECKEIIRQQFIQANKRKKLKILLEQKKQQQLHNQIQSEESLNQNQNNSEKEKELENGNQVNGKQAGESIDIEENQNNENKKDGEQKETNNISEESQKPQTEEVSASQPKNSEEVENDNKMAIEEQVNGDQEKAKSDNQQQENDQEKQKIDIEEEQPQDKKEDKKEEKEEQQEVENKQEENDIVQNKENTSEKVDEKKLTVVDVELSETNDKDEDKNFIQDEDEEDDAGFKIDKLNVSLNCTFGFNTIKTPAKGKYCKHVQCFSLENMILITEATVPRKWKCPICKLKCYDIVIDSYMQKIINTFKEQNLNVTEISFDQEANYEIHKLKKESDDEDDFDDEINIKPATTNATAPASQQEANKENKAQAENQQATDDNQNQEKSDQKNDQQPTDGNQNAQQSEGEKKKKKVSNEDPVIILDEDEDEAEQKKKQLQKLLLAAENGQANGKSDKQQGASVSQDGKENNDQEKQQAMNIENNNEGKETEEKQANETNKGGEMTKEKVEIPDSFFKLKEKLQQSIQSSANIYSDDYTYEEFFETQTEKVQELKLKSVRQSCRNKITKNLKKHYPELVNLIKKDATAQVIASLDQYEQNNSRRNNLYMNDYSKILNSSGQISKETATIKNKGLNKSSSTGLHTAATSATLQLPSALYGYDILGTQSLINPFSSNSFNLFTSRNPSTYNFMPITSQANSATVGASGAAPSISSSNLNAFVAPLTSGTAASTNPAATTSTATATAASTAAAGTAASNSSTAAAAQQYYQLLEQQNDFSNVFNQFQFGFGGQSNQLSSLFNIAQLTQPNAYSSTSASDPSSLYNTYMNLGLYGNLLGGQSNVSLPNNTSNSAQVGSTTVKKSQKQKSGSSAAKKSSNSQAASQNTANTSAGSNKNTGATQEVVNKGKADDPICLEDD